MKLYDQEAEARRERVTAALDCTGEFAATVVFRWPYSRLRTPAGPRVGDVVLMTPAPGLPKLRFICTHRSPPSPARLNSETAEA